MTEPVSTFALTGPTMSKTYEYVYASGKLMRQILTVTIGNSTTTYAMDFFYDASGMPFAVKYNGDLCYYITNLQGDVMSIVDAAGVEVAGYQYDPYGNIISQSGPLAEVNPLRYRGYVYDTETTLYYLQSRYYDPEMGRFINADALVSTGQGILGNNMFAYCLNNPVVLADSSGTAAHIGFSADGQIHDAPWRIGSPGGGGINRNIVIPSTAQYLLSKSIIMDDTSNPDEISIHIQFNTEKTKANIIMGSEALNEYVHLLNMEIMKITGNGLDENNLKQLYGEINFHIIGWDTKFYHFLDERFRVTEIDIVDGRVEDPRWYVNVASWFFRGGYDEH